MSEEQGKENIGEELREVRKRLLTLEWDKKHNQLNAGMESAYRELKERYKALTEKTGAQKG